MSRPGVRQRRREVGDDPFLQSREHKQIIQLVRLPENALHRFRPVVMISVAVTPKRGRIHEAFPAKHAHLWRGTWLYVHCTGNDPTCFW